MKSLKYILITFIVAITFTSCNGWLDVQPEDGVVRERYWKTKEEVRAAVLGCYSQMLDVKMMRSYFIWGEMRAEMAIPGSAANSHLRALNNGEITADNTFSNWDSFYATINQCNTVIELAPLALKHDESFSEQQLKEYIAEVTCIRSLMYFYLVRTFRDVPYYEMAYIYDYQDFALPKTDGKTIIDNLIASLEAIENNIPVKYDMTNAAYYENSDPNKGRFNYYGWAALLADIYLWKGEYEKCISLTDRIINSGQYSLVPVSRDEQLSYNIDTGLNDTIFEAVQGDVNAMFATMYANGNSVESIFELQNPPTYNNPYVEMFSGNVVGSYSIEANVSILSSEYFVASNIDRVWRDIRTEGISCVGRYIWKWSGLDNSQTVLWRTLSSSTSNWIFYRLADIILMKAEALTQQSMADNNQEKLQQALALVRQIRVRANAPESTDMFYKNDAQLDARTMEEFVLAERCRELTFEGKRWFDLVRIAQRDNYSEYSMSYLIRMVVLAAPPEKTTIIQSKWQTNKGSLYMPIITTELNRNKNLIQNDFYAK
jgi:SusD family.